ncbi:hypothetical protein C2G38_2211141 [Gigaspora rosea]|uniref:Histidine kinase-like ATPase n=1 Tax=Gigaspora rosea TaxID=44941 RepID=A0A397UEB2_9GLOM|nr:hypothetical protein C2G38_2211141 [Gigaspora rosea]
MANNSVSNNGNSNLIERFYNYDWSSTSLGPVDSWEPQIKSIVNLCFKSGFPTYILMGQDWITIYNEASIPAMQSRHPHAFIKPAIEIWGNDMSEFFTDLKRVRESGKGIYGHNKYIEAHHDGYKEEMYLDFALNPIYKLDDAESLESTCQNVMKALQNNKDISYALIYLIENNKDPKTGFNSPVAQTHEMIELTKISDQNFMDVKCATSTYSFLKCDSWPINLVMKEESIQVLLKDNSQAILLPIKLTFCNERNLSAVLILIRGMSIEEEKRRAKILADLNHQKDMFFKSISHELKTPLTLIFSPLDELINIYSPDTQMMSYLQIIQRNTRRLFKLINTLLQLAMNFENITSKLGLEYIIDVPNSDEFYQTENVKIYLDHDMYETIVFNLCSNAIKHTWTGSIYIRLYLDNKNEKKCVGIPKTILPNIFQRFYRVESQSSRSHEGAGIGLTIVKEFVKCHGGDITVTSVVNKGTTFKCWFPIGCKHLPINQIYYNNNENYLMSNNQKYSKRQLYIEENLQWIQNDSSSIQDNMSNKNLTSNYNMDINKFNDIISTSSTDSKENSLTIINKKYQILVVDDNTDMRNYLSDLLREFNIICACDGQDAIQILHKLDKLPDLILSDIMMPNMNGYKLLDIIRSNIKTQLIPIILLTAKAGEESSIKGFEKGANNYLKNHFLLKN